MRAECAVAQVRPSWPPPLGLRAWNAPHKDQKAVDELSKLFFGGVVHDPPTLVEDGCCARHKPQLPPRMGCSL